MKTLRVLLLALIAWTLFPAPVEAATIYNRYGMVLIKESNGSYRVVGVNVGNFGGEVRIVPIHRVR